MVQRSRHHFIVKGVRSVSLWLCLPHIIQSIYCIAILNAKRLSASVEYYGGRSTTAFGLVLTS